MRQSRRALAESFFLHGLIAGMLFITAGMIKTPPKTLRLDVSLLEQIAAPLRQVTPVHKAVVPDPEPVAQPQPVPKPQPKVAPLHPKKIKKSIAKLKSKKSEPAPVHTVQEPPRQAVASPAKPSPVQAESRNRPQMNAGTPERAIATSQNMSKLHSYLGIIRLRIEREKRYPLWARSHRLEGKVSVRFILSPDGQVSAVSVSKSSGQGCLDEAAIDAVRQASPMPPPPEGVLSKATPMELTIVFKLT